MQVNIVMVLNLLHLSISFNWFRRNMVLHPLQPTQIREFVYISLTYQWAAPFKVLIYSYLFQMPFTDGDRCFRDWSWRWAVRRRQGPAGRVSWRLSLTAILPNQFESGMAPADALAGALCYEPSQLRAVLRFGKGRSRYEDAFDSKLTAIQRRSIIRWLDNVDD